MDKFIKIQLGKSKYAIARQRPGGWFGIVATADSQVMADMIFNALVETAKAEYARRAA